MKESFERISIVIATGGEFPYPKVPSTQYQGEGSDAEDECFTESPSLEDHPRMEDIFFQ